ncbi:hypothetical protein AB0N07_43605 [Streptomyces sp. NPDC051172]|uniref:hypothetical protein n=1 Tax=Streptomyces sp. NPDC051172 TaxID=3155796 RepID=UPI003423CECD
MVPGDGAIRVLYGGADYARQPFNDAIAGAVEAGSALAPLRATEPGAAAVSSLVRTPTPTPLQLASAYATASAQGTYAKPYTVTKITRGGRTLYTAHRETRDLLSAVGVHPAATGMTGYTGTAGSGATTTRTLWRTESDPQLTVTVALFAEHPAKGKRAATPGHLPSASAAKEFATGVAERVREEVAGS